VLGMLVLGMLMLGMLMLGILRDPYYAHCLLSRRTLTQNWLGQMVVASMLAYPKIGLSGGNFTEPHQNRRRRHLQLLRPLLLQILTF
jgi:hypothetical protein